MRGRPGGGRGVLRPSTALLVALLVALAGCSTIDGLLDDDGEDAAPSAPITDSPGDESATSAAIDVSEPQVLPASTTYVEALCAIDPYEAAGTDDPLSALAEAYRGVPTSSRAEQEEIEQIAAAIEKASSEDLEPFTDAVSTLRARCAAVVLR